MSLSLGIVGLPNVGKSTLFNALTRNNVLAANYPFATIEPNEGVVALPDPRLGKLAELFGSEKIVPAPVTFVDIAGIVKGASEGAGLGNKFLANIRECDAICQVVRVFADDDVVHVDGAVDPRSDIEVIETELILADMQTLEKAVPRLEKEARNNKERKPVYDAVLAAQAVLDSGTTLFAAGAKVDSALLRELNLLTTKPFLYVFNADESILGDDAKIAELRAMVAPCAPASPLLPVGPVAPVAPVAPAPAGPVGPVAPCSPVPPAAPLSPLSPWAPVGPVDPVGPAVVAIAHAALTMRMFGDSVSPPTVTSRKRTGP